MISFAPEFAQFWLAAPTACAAEAAAQPCDDEAARERAALEELAERVNAARSIV